MAQFKLHLRRLNIFQIAVILLILGLFFGILAANIFHDSYDRKMTEYQSIIFTQIARSSIDYNGLFLYVLGQNFKEFAVFWLLSITILGIPYMIFKLIAFGFTSGFFISAVAMQYGFKGFLLLLVYPFPHGLLYLPLALLCLYKGYGLCRTIYYEKRSYPGTILHQLKQNMLFLLLMAVLLLLASLLEAYVGSYLLKKTLNLFT
jgi:stage II sporulation protein M